MRVSLGRVAAVCAAVLVLAPVGPAEAAYDTTVTITIQDEDGVALGSPAINTFVTVCEAGPDCIDRRIFGVDANGQAVVPVDSAISYGMSVSTYRFVTVTGLPLTSTPVRLPGVGQPRTVQGFVTVNGAAPPPGAGPGVAACPTTVSCGNPPLPGQSQYQVALAAPSGAYSFVINSKAAYNLTGFTTLGGIRPSATTTLPAGTAVVPLDFDVPWGGSATYHGTVSRTGFTTFAPNSAGVGACPTGTPYGSGCSPIVAYAAADGAYSLVLPAGSWAIAGFLFIDGSPVVGTPQTVTAVAGGNVTLNVSADVNSPGTPSTTVPVQGTSSTVGVATSGGNVSNVAAVPAWHTAPPPGVVVTTPLVSFTAGPVLPGATVTVDLTFSDTLPAAFDWYKVRNGTWTAYAGAVRVDDHTVRLTIVDGSAGDDDGVVNGYVTDPGAVVAADLVFSGFLAPIDPDDVNAAKAGRTIPIKWHVYDDGSPESDPAHLVRLSVGPAATADCAGDESVVTTITSGASGLQYLGDGDWQYNWRTDASLRGCRTLTLQVAGAPPVEATFRFR